MITLQQLLEEMIQKKASDLHLTAGVSPVFRVDGELIQSNHDVLTPEMTQTLAYSILNDRQKKKFEMEQELDLSFGVQGLSRFRGNIFLQRGCTAMALRTIPWEIRTFQELGLPPVAAELASMPKGLVLVTGPTGSGKSTTLATMIDKINVERRAHILTVEDPIEYMHRHKKSIVNQRQLEADTKSFENALKYVLRQDPDVVLVGEMRDLVTFEAALRIAETGHLTFATLHTNSAAESIHRIIDAFPAYQQPQVRAQLAFVLNGVMTQQLLPLTKGGRTMALEVMICTPAIKAMIRDDKVHQIYSLIQAGSKYGMQTMNQSLFQLFMDKKISLDSAFDYTSNSEELDQMIKRRQVLLA
ncbi:type IV pilus twitching motility protein PilT [candidate division TA06 bacterium]|uniref:Type IV pilus twitching motility protein PilT n=1 Tax=candidate division TA06 bacterium TaxID=2250710 RepID=A0A933IDV7_UNCT6|nr:type IV pilus twitching motility protein PilT [candidate division TA06 bacterium]